MKTIHNLPVFNQQPKHIDPCYGINSQIQIRSLVREMLELVNRKQPIKIKLKAA